MEDSYQRLNSKKVEIVPILSLELEEILRAIRRKVSTKISVKTPKQVLVEKKIHTSIFNAWYIAIKTYKTEFGPLLEVTRNKKNIISSITVKFVTKGSLKLHLNEATNKTLNIEQFLSKKFRGGSKGKIVVSEEKPFVLQC